MQELSHTFFSVLRLAKVFFDSDVPDKAKKDLRTWELDEDNCYVLGLKALEWIFLPRHWKQPGRTAVVWGFRLNWYKAICLHRWRERII